MIREHRVSHYEALVCRCDLFYQEALVDLHCHYVKQVNTARACMEALLSASQCMIEYEAVLMNSEQSKALGSLAFYGSIQALTQIVESVTGLEGALDIDVKVAFPNGSSIKNREHWKFRNRHSHVVNTRKSVRSAADPETANYHVFRLGRSSAGHLSYMTLAENGYMIRPISTKQIAWELQYDLGIFFDAALAAIRSCPET